MFRIYFLIPLLIPAYFKSQRRSFGALIRATGAKVWALAQAFLWSYLMLVPLLALPWALGRDRWLWFTLFIGWFFSIAMLLSTWVWVVHADAAKPEAEPYPGS